MPPSNVVRFEAFSREGFEGAVKSLSRSGPAWGDTPQVEYLAAYLEACGATTLVLESHYVDRHFMEEFGLYYSKCLSLGRNDCGRIHAFAQPPGKRPVHEAPDFVALLESLGRDPHVVGRRLSPSYLGFVVVRPLATAPIGRTVLRPPRDHSDATWITCRQTPHVLGIELDLEGLAFQQQDRAVGACATTAIWTALQKACRRDGSRSPTPPEITTAASRYDIALGRPFPSPGLTVAQICEALRSFGFPPHLFSVDSPTFFRLRLDTYLRSGIPVVLLLEKGQEKHAVTVAGGERSASRTIEPGVQHRHLYSSDTAVPFDIKNLRLERVFVHDDRIGPYVPATLKFDNGQVFLQFGPDLQDGDQRVTSAAVPLYPKIRANAGELFDVAFEHAAWLADVVEESPERLELDLSFERSGKYLQSLYRRSELPLEAVVRFQGALAPSRYLGVTRWTFEGLPLLDFLWDTTDKLHGTNPSYRSLLGVVAFEPGLAPFVDQLAAWYELSAVLTPAG